MATSKQKIEAIYALRKSAEDKVLAELEAATHPSVANKGALLDAQLDLENRTMEAIEVCHECGQEHESGSPHPRSGDVIPFDQYRGRTTE